MARAFAKQTRVKFLPELEVRDGGSGLVEVLKGGRWERVTMEEAVEIWKRRETAIKNAELDPFRHGHEPEVWDAIDWEICRLRVANPHVAVEMLVLGGNGSGKSYYGVSRQMRCGVYNAGWLIWNFTTDELKSKTVMQQIAYKFLPRELRPDDPRQTLERDRDQYIVFKNASGFADNKIGFPGPKGAPGGKRKRGSLLQFRYHSADLDTLTGPRPEFAYSDEEITLPWVEAITNRLHTAAERATAQIPLFEELLARKRREPGLKFPPDLVHLLFLGVHLITFTPEHGYNSVVHAFTHESTVVQEVDAELLPVRDEEDREDHATMIADCGLRIADWENPAARADGEDRGAHNPQSAIRHPKFEKVPKLLHCRLPHRRVMFMHPYENVHGGNWEGMKRAARNKTRENILWWAYGVASRRSHVLFPKFSRGAHVRRHEECVKACREGTLWLAVDPAAGRNMFGLWAVVNPLNEIYIVHEWPQEDDFIPGHGYLGPWAVEGLWLDGEKGPAQEPLGMGYIREAEEMERIERKLHLEIKGAEGRLMPFMEIIDSRTGNTPTASDSETRTLIQLFGTQGRCFIPAGRESGAAKGSTSIDESVKLVSALLDYDADCVARDENGKMSFLGKAPRLFVSERCTNLIFSLATWTNADGQKGACKDPLDCLRYLAMADPFYRAPVTETWAYGGVY